MTDADLADIERTIRYWRARGLIADVARELRCERKWESIRRRMVKLAMGWEIEELQRKAA